MTREEQIEAAALSYVSESHGLDDIDCVIEGIRDDFSEGAKWADSHPNWHKYPDEKPNKEENPEWSKTVLIAIQGLDISVKAQLHFPTKNNPFEYWYTLELGCHIDKEDVLAWMELPKSPRFD